MLLMRTWKHECPLSELTRLLVRNEGLLSFSTRKAVEGCVTKVGTGLLPSKEHPSAGQNARRLPAH